MAQPYAPLVQHMLLEFQRQNLESAIRIAHSILGINSKDIVALQVLGLSFAMQGELLKAVTPLSKAAAQDPKNSELLSNLAKAQFGSELFNEAIKTFEKLNRLIPNNAQLLTDKGSAHGKLRQYDLSAACYDRALELEPGYFLAWSNYGNLWSEQGYPNKALKCYETALEHNPNYPETWTNYGNALYDLGRYEEALLKHEKALTLNPHYGEAWLNRGNTLLELKHSDGALECYEKAYEIIPQHPFLLGLLYNLYRNIFDWSKSEPLVSLGLEAASKSKGVFPPFIFLQTSASVALQKLVGEVYIQNRIFNNNQSPFPILKANSNRKIRIGYFSSDFKEHPVGISMENVILLHDRNQFEVYGYFVNKKTDDALEGRFTQAFDKSINLFGILDQDAHEMILEHDLDIAIDLNGHTDGARTALFSRKVAPIQVSYLGYAGTMGADFYQHLIADRIVIPSEYQKDFSEKIEYMPNSFFPADSLVSLESLGPMPSRSSQGLPEKGFIFSSFNNAYKISPQIFEYWMRLLKEVPDSVLWLARPSDIAIENLMHHVIRSGISPDRLVFAPRVPDRAAHLSRLRLADLFLDTFRFNAHSTAADTLWAGVPVLTMLGDTFASRVAASQLTALGLPELITQSEDEYFAKALELASKPHLLKSIRGKLESNRLTTPLFDTKQYVKDLEALYLSILKQYH